jgi:hypothetical protein
VLAVAEAIQDRTPDRLCQYLERGDHRCSMSQMAYALQRIHALARRTTAPNRAESS